MKDKNFNQGGVAGLEATLAKFQFQTGAAKRAALYEKLSSLIGDGTPLDAALRQLMIRYTEKKRPLAPVMRAWMSALDQGKTFADAVKDYVSDTEGIIIAAGEKSGDLAVALDQAALVARARSDINKALRVELSTPAIQIVVLICLLVGFSTTMAPGLLQTVPFSALDASQRNLFGLAAIVAKTWWFAVPLMAAALWVAIWSMPRYTGPLRPFLDRLPPWSIYRVYSGSTFMISLAALIKAGVPIEAAIRFIRNQSSPWMRVHLSEMVARLRSGADQGASMDVGMLNDDLADAVAIYSKTTSFDVAMTKIGKDAIETGIEGIKANAGTAKIVSIILIGVFVGWMFDAMMGLTDATKRAQQQQTQIRR